MKNKMGKGQKRLKADIKSSLKKTKKHQYHREHNKNISKEEKETKVEYMRNCYLSHKNNYLTTFQGSIEQWEMEYTWDK